MIIVFDLDGTLLNTLDDLADAVNFALQNNGMPQRSLSEVRAFVGNGVRNLMLRAVADGTTDEKFAKVFADFQAYYQVHCNDKTRPYEGILDALDHFAKKSYKLAVVSNKLDVAVRKLNELYFSKWIPVAIGEREGIPKKPAPDMVRLAVDAFVTDQAVNGELAVDEHAKNQEMVVYIGDSEVDVQTANNAGVPCVTVTWGFRDERFLKEQGATTFVHTPQELCACLDKMAEKIMN